MINQVGQQYHTYGNPLKDLIKRSHKLNKSILRPVYHSNAISIDSLGSEDGTTDSFGSFSHARIDSTTSQTQEEMFRSTVDIRGPEIDPKVLMDTLTFYSGYRGYCVAGIARSRKAVGGYSVKVQRRSAILVSADEYGVVILSNDDGSLQYRISWSEMADIDHVHTDETSTPLRKRKRTNYLALRLKDGSVSRQIHSNRSKN
ncbi:hypothetical protein SARC_03814 [Sphaeroforma arctica JP610]|uniref:Uncharacterized protein n=1 Tax=Sphaeroforma arctica JP610 TaxID=667725 RepID=A0A0L0G4H1_9EUKA|nr:hypothetical protein SARC_03814 [Sphaeroforma arctica JP610]KNC83950.1 hypothetical protein SARC_03814 [Sphaeroforma arctica JP610]|eukprot:XP_014157852.1 hypothetical protein SARC_03814 [Sphaeroforma arctica JP610]